MKMTFAYWILLMAFFLPYLCAGIAKAGRRDYDNTAPRAWEGQLEGYRSRAVAAMNNSFEALPFFAAAVIVAHQLGANQGRIDSLALAWLILRFVYVGLYVSNRASLRSVVWLLGLCVTVGIFVQAA